MLLTLLLFAAYCAIYPLLDTPSKFRTSPHKIILVGVILGLGVLTKGPVALVLCALSALIYLILTRRNPLPLIRESWPWQLLAVSIAFGAIWYVPAALTGGQKILRIIFAENFGHFMPTKLGGTGESYRPFYFIAARLLGGAFPMTLLIVPAALAFYTGEISTEKRNAVIYQISMPLAVLIFFTIASVKRDDYILPALPGIAILCASVFNLNGLRGTASKLRDVLVALFVFCPVVAILFVAFFPDHPPLVKLQSSDAAYYTLLKSLVREGPVAPLFDVWMVAVVIEILALGRRSAMAHGLAFALTALPLCLLWTTTMRPGLAVMRSVRSFVPIVAEHVRGDQLCIPSGINYELSYYYSAAVPDVSDPRCVNGAAGKPVYLLATPRELNAMSPEYRARLKLVAQSNLIGGGGPPALYEISPEAAR